MPVHYYYSCSKNEFHRRTQPSSYFKKNLIEALLSQSNYKITRKLNSPDHQEYDVVKGNGHTYRVTINRRPFCSCPAMVSAAGKRQCCKHILSILLQLGVSTDSTIMFQRIFELEELRLFHTSSITPLAPEVCRNIAQPRSKHVFYLGKYDSGTKQKKVKGRPPLCGGCAEPICKKQSGVIPCLEIDGRYRQGNLSQPKVFRYHINEVCMRIKYRLSDLPLRMPVSIVHRGEESTDEDVAHAQSLLQSARVV